MPRAYRVCTTDGCTTLVRQGKCPECVRQGERKRGSFTQRGYGSAWRATRAAFLRRHPRCAWPGCTKPATDVDHRDGQGPTGVRGYDLANFVPYCHAHHSAKTARHDGGFGRVFLDGGTLDG